MATANVEMQVELDKIKKASSVALKKKLIRYGFTENVVDSLDRDELIHEVLALSSCVQSKLPAPTNVSLVTDEEDDRSDEDESERNPNDQGETLMIDPSLLTASAPADQSSVPIGNQMSSDITALISFMMQQQQQQQQERSSIERVAREDSRVAQLKRYGDAMKNVLVKFPNDDQEICIRLDSVE